MTVSAVNLEPLDEAERRRHKWRNRAQSLLLLAGMVGLLSACAWLVFGGEGVLWALVGWLAALLLSPQISPRFVLRLYRARPIDPRAFPAGYEMARELSARAGLPQAPNLYYVPSTMLNAFAVGDRGNAAIAFTDGMLRALTLRELGGVLAHELSHVRNNDLWIMNLADSISRLTSLLSFLGILVLFISLPYLLVAGGGLSWLLAGALLWLAPLVVSLLQLALSRSREYDADLDAAGLTGDPAGLASALEKLERHQSRFWERIMLPGHGIPDPSLLRTHPPTEERVRRLLALAPDAAPYRPATRLATYTDTVPPVALPPRWRPMGLWY